MRLFTLNMMTLLFLGGCVFSPLPNARSVAHIGNDASRVILRYWVLPSTQESKALEIKGRIEDAKIYLKQDSEIPNERGRSLMFSAQNFGYIEITKKDDISYGLKLQRIKDRGSNIAFKITAAKLDALRNLEELSPDSVVVGLKPYLGNTIDVIGATELFGVKSLSVCIRTFAVE